MRMPAPACVGRRDKRTPATREHECGRKGRPESADARKQKHDPPCRLARVIEHTKCEEHETHTHDAVDPVRLHFVRVIQEQRRERRDRGRYDAGAVIEDSPACEPDDVRERNTGGERQESERELVRTGHHRRGALTEEEEPWCALVFTERPEQRDERATDNVVGEHGLVEPQRPGGAIRNQAQHRASEDDRRYGADGARSTVTNESFIHRTACHAQRGVGTRVDNVGRRWPQRPSFDAAASQLERIARNTKGGGLMATALQYDLFRDSR